MGSPAGGTPVHLEDGVAMAWESGAAVWSFDPAWWGSCVQGRSAQEALARWSTERGPVHVVEVVVGDELAFRRDHDPVTDAELRMTLDVLEEQRLRALGLLERLDDADLDREDPGQDLPSWAGWRTVRQRLWHVCDTESRYYLPRTGLPGRARAPGLRDELQESAAHVRQVLATMPRDRVEEIDGEIWTSTKLLRRLAWHERGELDAIEDLLGGL